MRPSVAGDTNMGSWAWDGRLRGELTEFIGQREELALVRQALGAARLVTLTGPGGSARPGWPSRLRQAPASAQP
jgi:hypothetical protein